MLKCKDINRQASDYLDHHLTARQRLAFALHLLICGKCRAFVTHLKKALTTFNSKPSRVLSEEETDKLVERTLSHSDG